MIRKAVIPAAGFGTRLLPATKSQPKEMLPIVDRPAIQYVVEEAVASGITDILMVIAKGKRAIEEHFDRNFELESELEEKNKTLELEAIRRISSLANVHFVWQKELRGLGDAVACARDHVGGDPFAVLLGDTLVPIPMQPGKCYKYDYHYERHGVCNLFIAVEPLRGFRFAQIYKQRTKLEYAAFMKAFANLPRYANVAGFRLVQDNLNTHNAGSFYQAFDPETARQLKQKFEYHYTPTNASWLNMAEIELSAIARQCLHRRIPEQELLEHEVLACVKERNDKEMTLTWQFTTNDARKKLKRHYNAIKN